MKKKVLLFVALLMALVACDNGGEPVDTNSTPNVSSNGGNSDTSMPAIENTIYFNLGKYGLFNGQKGSVIADANLENGYQYTALVGSDLPGADKVTSSQGNKFLYWVMPSSTGGSLMKVDKMPASQGMVLEAWWEEGDVDPDPTPNPDTDYQFLATSYDSDVKYKLSKGKTTMFPDADLDGTEWSITEDFEAGYEFKFFSTKSLFNTYTSNTYPTLKAGTGQAGYSLCADTKAGNYTKTYIEVTGSPAGSGTNTAGEDWYKFTSGDAAPLKFKVSGNYTLYIRLYNSGDWLQIYAVKNK